MVDAFGFSLLAQGPMDLVLGVLGFGLGIFLLIILLLLFSYGSLYIQALLAGCRVPLFTIFGMKLRGVIPTVIVNAKIMLTKAGIETSTDALETHYLARGNVQRVAQAIVNADKANIKLGWSRACAIDLAGRDILDAVRTSVNPKVIDCPSAEMNRPSVDGVAKDGIQLKVKARVTVRTNMERLVGGATEQTIIARVGEGIVQAIGQAPTHKEVLASPDQISKAVLAKGLDAGTAFDILSIDIADVDVGENIGAKLQTDQAQADLKVAQAKAEERRAMAVAHEQEMTAETQANRAQVVLAEADIPKAIAQAFREGNLGIMDYYNIRNIQADTDMRRGIGGASDGKPA